MVTAQSKEKLMELVKKARGDMTKRAFGRLLGVTDTAVRLWETGQTFPETEQLSKLAARTGYSLEELISYLEGKPVSSSKDMSDIVEQIRYMPLSEVAEIGKAVAERFAQVAQMKEY